MQFLGIKQEVSFFFCKFATKYESIMSTRLSIQDALKRVHLNTVTLKNEEHERFIRALQIHIKPRNQITNFLEKVHEQHVRDLKDKENLFQAILG